VPSDEAVQGVLNDWAAATPSFIVQDVRERGKTEAARPRTNPKRPPGNLGSSQGVRKQQIALQWALDDLLEIVEAKTNDEEIRALAMRVQRLR
jgi:hypothetical protein